MREGWTREVLGILLLAVSAFSVLALYVDATGWVGLRLRGILRMSFGDLAVLFVLLAAAGAVQVIWGRKRPLSRLRLLGLFLLIFSVTLGFHMLYYRGYQFPPNLREEISYGLKGEGAGVLGALFLVFFYNAVGIQGSILVIGTAVLLGLIFFFRISLVALLKKTASYLWHALAAWWHRQLDSWHRWRDRRRLKRLEKQTAGPGERQKKEAPAVAPEKPKAASSQARKSRKSKPKEETEPEPEPVPEPEPAAEPLVFNLPAKGSGSYVLPPTYLLKKGGSRGKRGEGTQQDLLEETFANFGIEAKVVNVEQGPVVTRYELQPAPGIKVSRITALADDLALALAARMCALKHLFLASRLWVSRYPISRLNQYCSEMCWRATNWPNTHRL